MMAMVMASTLLTGILSSLRKHSFTQSKQFFKLYERAVIVIVIVIVMAMGMVLVMVMHKQMPYCDMEYTASLDKIGKITSNSYKTEALGVIGQR